MRISAVKCCRYDSTGAVSGFKMKLAVIDRIFAQSISAKDFVGGSPKEIETECIGSKCDLSGITCQDYNTVDASVKSLTFYYGNDGATKKLIDINFIHNDKDMYMCG